MPVTALLGVRRCVVLHVAPAREAFAPFADPLIFLFIGSFMLARAIFLHGLDRRFAFGVLSLRWVGGAPVAHALRLRRGDRVHLDVDQQHRHHRDDVRRSACRSSASSSSTRRRAARASPGYATALMLMTSFAASIGGLATPVGTPPNLIGLGFIRRILGVEFPFFKWMPDRRADWSWCSSPGRSVFFDRLRSGRDARDPGQRGDARCARRRALGAWTHRAAVHRSSRSSSPSPSGSSPASSRCSRVTEPDISGPEPARCPEGVVALARSRPAVRPARHVAGERAITWERGRQDRLGRRAPLRRRHRARHARRSRPASPRRSAAA